jgi:hypothetical protein
LGVKLFERNNKQIQLTHSRIPNPRCGRGRGSLT